MRKDERKILVVDDDRDSRDAVQTILEGEELGYGILTAADGREALGIYRSEPSKVVLIITDNSMPGMTGAELLVEVKRLNPDAKVIMVSGDSERAFRNRLKELGLNAFLAKPITAEQLVEAVQTHLPKALAV